ncbi:histidine kinase [Eggerthia catenaformis]|uniref:GAF domain-containing protein n=1 Tax=Eggerthia catenaformis TaxID=31973 RepID=UPI000552A02F|nr:GAF domain-containing protein [Eggerthia catenaformis]OUC51840.1 histidine kinase [Eggerthia catenaformis]
MKNLAIDQLRCLIENETDMITNMANISAYINDLLDDINWVGFYLYKDNMLVLGPFQGHVACNRIKPGQGVCGTSAKERKTIIVDDVHLFKGHIACDSQSQSEIVIPLIKNNQLLGVLDIDSPIKKRFTDKDQKLLEDLVSMFITYL